MATWGPITIIDTTAAGRPSAIYQAICEYAGIKIPAERVGPGETIVKEGYGSPYVTASDLRAQLGDDNAIVMAFPRHDADHLQLGTTWAAISSQRAAVCRQDADCALELR